MRSGLGNLGGWDVWVQGVERGAARQLTSEAYVRCSNVPYDSCLSPTWTRDGEALLFTGNGQILRVALGGGEPEPVVGVGQDADSPSIQGQRMVFVQRAIPATDIWRLPGPGEPPSG
jgi:hypothetical protein